MANKAKYGRGLPLFRDAISPANLREFTLWLEEMRLQNEEMVGHIETLYIKGKVSYADAKRVTGYMEQSQSPLQQCVIFLTERLEEQ